jgi:DNA-binding LacI/PurR family transcriptional regulator
MRPLRRQTVSDQTAAHLREGLRSGRWGLKLPGVLRLAAELEVSKDAVRAALRRLEEEGVLHAGGSGRQRTFSGSRAALRGSRQLLRVGILLSRPLHTENGASQRMLLRLLHQIEASGHSGFFAPLSQLCLGHELPRVARAVQEGKADAWVVVDASEELLGWFSTQPVPAIALGGRYSEVPLGRVAMDLTHGFLEAVRALKKLGHRRIVVAVPRVWRQPVPGRLVTAVLEEIGGGAPEYHVPDWEPGARGFNDLLESLFRVTPPTAMLVIEPAEAVAVISFLAQRGLRVPRDLSLVCRHRDASLDLCRPEIAHLSSNEDHLVRHIARWVNAAARGTPHQRRIVCQPEFFPCESLARPWML